MAKQVLEPGGRKKSRARATSGALDFIAGGGEMGALIRAKDWSQTPIGQIESWPQSLRTTVNICLSSDLPICIIWGRGLVQIYNDSYRVICGEKHPRSMGQNFPECWREAWPVIGEAHDSALAGKTAFLESQHIFLERHGYTEECFFTFSFSPIRDESGGIGGLFHPVIEMTAKNIGERRTRTLRDVAARTTNATRVEQACALAAQSLAGQELDVPFALIYLFDQGGASARLAGSTGLPAGTAASPERIETGETHSWPLAEVANRGVAMVVEDLEARFGRVVCGPYPESPSVAIALPLTLPGSERPAGVLVAGVSGRLKLNEVYRDFYDLLAAAVTTALANGRTFEEERKRVEALAELDRAKTTFFSNVSHEFRTPLTLMLGPLEDTLANVHGVLPLAAADTLRIAHRNSLRLLRMVNTLLDFSRVEAGRIEASYEPTDLAGLTADLASAFRSAIEKAGLRLIVDCPPLPEPVFVDREMWEKIVLNLLSNAFKFTFAGEVRLSLGCHGERVELRVSDTGIGIPPEDVPKIFQRFHRVKNARTRTHEGTGIGLALVQELVQLHRGEVSVESREGRGTTFTIAFPLGKAHLPADRIGAPRRLESTSSGAAPFIEEALRWLPDGIQAQNKVSTPSASASPLVPLGVSRAVGSPTQPPQSSERVLVVDDNADMRDYISRLLAGSYHVEVAPDGQAALEKIQARPPDLVVADVMMPRLDGFELLQALRAQERTRTIPFILLSARAGEESRIEGITAGADDYLIKPFSARELVARVRSQLDLTGLRRRTEQTLRENEQRLRQSAIELGLARRAALNLMEDALQAKDKTAASEERFRTLVMATSDVVYRMSADWTEMGQLHGRGFIMDTDKPSRTWLQEYIHSNDQTRVMAAIHEAIRTKSVFEMEHQIRLVDGTLGWTFSRAIPLTDAKGEIVEWFGAASDVTERKRAETALQEAQARLADRAVQLEAAVAERTTELTATNEQLESFVYSVAHDLRGPLRAMQGFSALLIEEAGARLSETGQDFAHRISRSALYMDALLRDLLVFSRLSKQRIELVPVDLNSVVDSTLYQLEEDIKEKKARVETPGPWPAVLAHEATVGQILYNLLSNALKFVRRETQPIIRLRTEERDRFVRVWVEDNGVGIAPEHQDQIFRLFSRLHGERYPGTGIGLTIVQKGAERMRGHAGVESAAGEGSRFWFELPKA